MGFNLADYEEVKDRIPRFWEKHDDGAIVTELIEHEGDSYIVLAKLVNGAGQVIATGLAQEHVTTSGVNKTSALENCETSAIGRALSNANFSSGGKRPSREEMTKAGYDEQTPPRSGSGPKLASEPQMKLLALLADKQHIPEGCPWPIVDGKRNLLIDCLPLARVRPWIDELKAAEAEAATNPPNVRVNTKEEHATAVDKMRADAEAAQQEFVG